MAIEDLIESAYREFLKELFDEAVLGKRHDTQESYPVGV